MSTLRLLEQHLEKSDPPASSELRQDDREDGRNAVRKKREG